MLIYNLIECSSNYFEITRSLQLYSKGEATNFNTDIENTDNFKSFKYKVKLLGNKVSQSRANTANGILRNVTIAMLLKHLGNFRRSFEMPLSN